MVIGFLGKGGSGKSTLSTGMVQFLHKNNYKVLAVDADHNMDLSYNLSYQGDGPFIGGTFLPLREEFGLDIEKPTEDIFIENIPSKRFSFTRPDTYSKKYVLTLDDNLYLMAAGPQSNKVLYGSHCSHSLAAPLKIYLPLLDLKEKEVVVVDEKASVDAVSTGIPTGFDLAVVVAEPRHHSLRVAQQIKEMLDWFEVPNITVLNKCTSREDENLFEKELGHKPFTVLNFNHDPVATENDINKTYQVILEKGKELQKTEVTRLDRTITKYRRNTEFQKKET